MTVHSDTVPHVLLQLVFPVPIYPPPPPSPPTAVSGDKIQDTVLQLVFLE